MVDKSNAKRPLLTFKGVVLATVFFIGIRGLHRWISEPYASGLITFGLGVIFYWIPPRPRVSYHRWVLWSFRVAAAVFIVMTVVVLISSRLR